MELQGDAKFLFFTMMQAALKMKEMGRQKEEFIMFATEIWVTMEMNDEESLKKTLLAAMMKDVKDFVKNKK